MKVFQIINKEINSKLIMVGDGPDKNKAKEYMKKNNLKSNVIFLGNTSQIDEILCSSDLFLLPSEKESFGLSSQQILGV